MKTKICTRCPSKVAEQPIENFRFRNKSKGTRAPWCKSCYSKYEKKKWSEKNDQRREQHQLFAEERRKRNTNFVWEFLSTKSCVDCGESDPIVLELDHIDPESKSYCVSTMRRGGWSLDAIKKEIDKCEVRCANCHRRKTAKDRGWDKIPVGNY